MPGRTLTTTATGLFSNVLLAIGTILGGTITPGGRPACSAGAARLTVSPGIPRCWRRAARWSLLDGLTLAPGNDTLDLSGGGAVLARDAETLDNILIRLGNNAALGTSGTGELSLGVHALATLERAAAPRRSAAAR